ncbi:hypothetical protein R3J21_02710 [Citrobacter werkmanii]|uniref:hypothetical protein n=1 Tax=Citrobacter werkmanii TaxID=67827 RepID=UPI00295534D5|nr:hypothetical protein [Citrobacter werkmanii]MDV7070450.1 hypothetical protein [Citrobacter werkmanii]
MTALNKQALRGQSVEGSYYLVECCNCGEMYPSNLLDGGEAIAGSGDYGDCYCHLCGADDTERADWGDVNSNEVKAWNFQQKRIEALLDDLDAAESQNGYLREQRDEWERKAISNFEECVEMAARIEELEAQRKLAFTASNRWADKFREAEKRIAELSASHSKLRGTMATIHNTIRMDGGYTPLAAILNAAKRAHEESATAAGTGVKGE